MGTSVYVLMRRGNNVLKRKRVHAFKSIKNSHLFFLFEISYNFYAYTLTHINTYTVLALFKVFNKIKLFSSLLFYHLH